MNKTQKKVIAYIAKTGWTFIGDSIFTTYHQAKRAITALVKAGLIEARQDDFGTRYFLTKEGMEVA